MADSVGQALSPTNFRSRPLAGESACPTMQLDSQDKVHALEAEAEQQPLSLMTILRVPSLTTGTKLLREKFRATPNAS